MPKDKFKLSLAQDRFTVVALFCLFMAVSASKSVCPDDYKPEIVGVPLSDRLVAGEIHLNAGEVVGFAAREGSVVVLKATDYHIAFSTRITPGGDVHLNYFNVTTVPGPEGGEKAVILGSASAAVGDFSFLGKLPFDVKVTLIDERKFLTPSFQAPLRDPDLLLRSQAASFCCARACDGTVLCTCSVHTGCASCCAGDCCFAPHFDGRDLQPRQVPK